jgi:hypothetical protein
LLFGFFFCSTEKLVTFYPSNNGVCLEKPVTEKCIQKRNQTTKEKEKKRKEKKRKEKKRKEKKRKEIELDWIGLVQPQRVTGASAEYSKRYSEVGDLSRARHWQYLPLKL